MAADKKISEFKVIAPADIDGSEYLGGYNDPGDPDGNIRMNVKALKENIEAGLGADQKLTYVPTFANAGTGTAPAAKNSFLALKTASATNATGTVNFPVAPKDGNTFQLIVEGEITALSSGVVAPITIQDMPTTAKNESFKWVFYADAIAPKWLRVLERDPFKIPCQIIDGILYTYRSGISTVRNLYANDQGVIGMYASSDAEGDYPVIESTDGGKNWTLLPLNTPFGVDTYISNGVNFTMIFNYHGDFGLDWVSYLGAFSTFPSGVLQSTIIHMTPGLGPVFLCAARNSGGSWFVIRTTDGGDNWSIVHSPAYKPEAIVTNNNGQWIVILSGGFYLRSLDGGSTFSTASAANLPTGSVISNGGNNLVSVGVYGGVQKACVSTDIGNSWLLRDMPQVGAFSQVLTNDSFWYILGGSKSCWSFDLGKNWIEGAASSSEIVSVGNVIYRAEGYHLMILETDCPEYMVSDGRVSFSETVKGKTPGHHADLVTKKYVDKTVINLPVVNGETIIIPPNSLRVVVILTPATTVASATFTLPDGATDDEGREVTLINGSATADITSFTLFTYRGLVGAITTLKAGEFATYRFEPTPVETWYRIG